MKRHTAVWAMGLVCGTLALGACFSTLQAQVKQGKTRPMKTEYLMEGVVKPHCTALKKGLEAAPADDKAWHQLAVHAALLSEVGYILMDDGRCPDKDWADATKTLREGSTAALKAIESKDYDAAKQAFGNLSKSCKSCHDKHKKD